MLLQKESVVLIIFFAFQGPLDFGPVVNDPVCGRPPNANRYKIEENTRKSIEILDCFFLGECLMVNPQVSGHSPGKL